MKQTPNGLPANQASTAVLAALFLLLLRISQENGLVLSLIRVLPLVKAKMFFYDALARASFPISGTRISLPKPRAPESQPLAQAPAPL